MSTYFETKRPSQNRNITPDSRLVQNAGQVITGARGAGLWSSENILCDQLVGKLLSLASSIWSWFYWDQTSDGLRTVSQHVIARKFLRKQWKIDEFIIIFSNRKSIQDLVSCSYSLGKHHWQHEHLFGCPQRQTSTSYGTKLRGG